MSDSFVQGVGNSAKIIGEERSLVAGESLSKGTLVSAVLNTPNLKNFVDNRGVSDLSTLTSGLCHLEDNIFAIFTTSGTTLTLKVIRVNSYSSSDVLATTTYTIKYASLISNNKGAGSIGSYKIADRWYLLFAHGGNNTSKYTLYSFVFTGSSITFNASLDVYITKEKGYSPTCHRTNYGFLVCFPETYGSCHIRHYTVSSGSITQTFAKKVFASNNERSTTYFSSVQSGDNTFIVGVDCNTYGGKTYGVTVNSESNITVADITTSVFVSSNYAKNCYDSTSGICALYSGFSGHFTIDFVRGFTKIATVSYSGYHVTDPPMYMYHKTLYVFTRDDNRNSPATLEVKIIHINDDNTVSIDTATYESFGSYDTPSANNVASGTGDNMAVVLVHTKVISIPLGDFIKGTSGTYIGVLIQDCLIGDTVKVVT